MLISFLSFSGFRQYSSALVIFNYAKFKQKYCEQAVQMYLCQWPLSEKASKLPTEDLELKKHCTSCCGNRANKRNSVHVHNCKANYGKPPPKGFVTHAIFLRFLSKLKQSNKNSPLSTLESSSAGSLSSTCAPILLCPAGCSCYHVD